MVEPAKTSYSRVFTIEGRAGPDNKPVYQTCMKSAGVRRDFGAVTRIYSPDPASYGKFIVIGSTKAQSSDATTTLTAPLMRTIRSSLLRMANIGCPLDVQVHFGACAKPNEFNMYDKDIVLEGVMQTNYGTGDLGALNQGEDGKVDETSDISAQEYYEVMPLTYAAKADDIITNEILDVIIADAISCGDVCATPSDGKQKIYAVTAKVGGSAGTPPDIVWSLNSGGNFSADDIDSLSSAQDPTGIAELGSYLVVTSSDAGNLSYLLKSGLTYPATLNAWTGITTGFVAAKGPAAIWSTGIRAFITGLGGYIYYCDDPTSGVTVMDTGAASGGDDLHAIHGLDNSFAVAVGDAGAICYMADGANWSAVTRFVNVNVGLTGVWVKSKTEWWVTTNTGLLYYTKDGGATWAVKGFSGSGAGICGKVKFATPTVGFMVHTTAANVGRLFKSIDGGYSWKIQPDSGTMPTSYKASKLAVTSVDPNFVVFGGLATGGTDGKLIIGSCANGNP